MNSREKLEELLMLARALNGDKNVRAHTPNLKDNNVL